MDQLMDDRLKSKWGHSSNYKLNILYEKLADSSAAAVAWPRRNFSCNFCNKEYKSAQALGGHMNIHRRDKARLGLNIASTPNPPNNYYLSPPSPAPYLPSLFPLLPTTVDQQQKLPLFACSGQAMENEENGSKVWKKYEIINMDLLKADHGNNIELELDLELRLGRS
ncbi:hypothetical protein QVD17_22225 [Tagetes erecta]|uniref:C2H2-type domain-containing protein n=1 Tax=Tagetes erecta TaxID=13708 RepID=A0AAD8NTF7_TARER|nr:hypothetical protein QVD17_22225 [Tagetes erecta]